MTVNVTSNVTADISRFMLSLQIPLHLPPLLRTPAPLENLPRKDGRRGHSETPPLRHQAAPRPPPLGRAPTHSGGFGGGGGERGGGHFYARRKQKPEAQSEKPQRRHAPARPFHNPSFALLNRIRLGLEYEAHIQAHTSRLDNVDRLGLERL